MGAIAASSVTYISPVVALFIGVVFVDEPILLSDYFATALIFAGVFLLNKKQGIVSKKARDLIRFFYIFTAIGGKVNIRQGYIDSKNCLIDISGDKGVDITEGRFFRLRML